jgi:hypothetical protein
MGSTGIQVLPCTFFILLLVSISISPQTSNFKHGHPYCGKGFSTAIIKVFPLIGCACITCFSGPLLNDAARLEGIMFLVKENKQLTNFAQACVKALGYQDALRFLAQVVLHCGTDNDPDCNAWDTDRASDEMSEANMKAKEKDSDTFGFSDLRTKW